MQRLFVLCSAVLILASYSQAQGTTPAPKKATPGATAAKPSDSSTKAAGDTSKPVITIDHLCNTGAKAFAADCKTVITEATLEKMLNTLAPDLPAQRRRRIGEQLGEMKAYSTAAKARGLDKTLEYEELMQVSKQQVLAQILMKHLQKDAENITPAEVSGYYDAHKTDLQEFSLIRVIVPKEMPAPGKTVDEAAEKQFAQQIRDRFAKGEDPKTLQSEAYKRVNQSAEPSVDINQRRRNSLPPSQAKVFDLKPGEVSDVIADPNAFFIYKLVSVQTPPLDKVSAELKRSMAQERFQAAKAKLDSQFSVKLDDAYFGPAPQQMPMGSPSLQPRGGPGGAAQLTPEQIQEIQRRLQQQQQQQQPAPTSPQVPK